MSIFCKSSYRGGPRILENAQRKFTPLIFNPKSIIVKRLVQINQKIKSILFPATMNLIWRGEKPVQKKNNGHCFVISDRSSLRYDLIWTVSLDTIANLFPGFPRLHSLAADRACHTDQSPWPCRVNLANLANLANFANLANLANLARFAVNICCITRKPEVQLHSPTVPFISTLPPRHLIFTLNCLYL